MRGNVERMHPVHIRVTDSPTDAATGGLQRSLGFWQLFASGVGIIVGAGIYVLIGEATAQAGAAVWLSFAIAAALSALTALSYCELASMYPRAAAEYEYTSHVFPRWAAFLVGWVMIAGLVVAAAAVSLGFARYATTFVNLDQRLIAVALIAALSAFALTGVERSSRLTLVLSAIQVGGLLVVVAIGAPHIGEVDLTESKGTRCVMGAAALVFSRSLGSTTDNAFGRETRNPPPHHPARTPCGPRRLDLLYVAVAIASSKRDWRGCAWRL